MTTLFIGHLSKFLTASKLEEAFKIYGECKVELKVNYFFNFLLINPKNNSYAFVQYKTRQEAELAMKYLNNTNLLGANGSFKVRIEFSYKNKIGERLAPNFSSSNLAESQSGFNNNFEKEQNIYNGNRINNTVIDTQNGQEAFSKDQLVEKNLITTPSNMNEITKGNFGLEYESCDKMQVDSEMTKKDLYAYEDSGENKNKNQQLDHFKEKRYHQSHSSNEKNYDKDERHKRNNDPCESDLYRFNICFICKLPGHLARDCILTKEFCYECGFKGHIARECNAYVRNAKTLTENRVKALLIQQMSYKFIKPGDKIRNLVNYYKNLKDY